MELLTANEVAEILKVKESTILTWVNRKQFPEEVMFKFGGKRGSRRFIKDKLEDWIYGCLQTKQ